MIVQNHTKLEEMLEERKLLIKKHEQYKLHCRMGNIKESLAKKIMREIEYDAKYQILTDKINEFNS
jgi:rhodanese-related sulfurtransferase